MSASRGDTARIAPLEERLAHFYNTSDEYPAFRTSGRQTGWLKLVSGEIVRKFLRSGSRIRVLEAGAGLGSIFENSGGLQREMLHYTAQEISGTVMKRLAEVADCVHFGPLSTVRGEFDLVFSLFVLEHIASPLDFLAEVTRLLRPDGTHIVICPRYDVPGYICPSMRHFTAVELLGIEALRLTRNALTRYLGAAPSFWVNTDPAMFHRQWRRDTDAVHIVSRGDLVQWHLKSGYAARRLVPESSGLPDAFIKRFATVCYAFDRRGQA